MAVEKFYFVLTNSPSRFLHSEPGYSVLKWGAESWFMACPRNESSDYAVFLAAYMRSVGDNIRLSFTCIKAAPLTCSAAVVIARWFFSQIPQRCWLFLSGCAIIFIGISWIIGVFTRKRLGFMVFFRVKTTLNQRFHSSGRGVGFYALAYDMWCSCQGLDQGFYTHLVYLRSDWSVVTIF